MNNSYKMDNFCKACGTLAAKGCPKGHSSTLNDKIKNVAHAEDGTRVLVSNNNAPLGKEFWSYSCEHHITVYVLRVQNKKPASSLRMPISSNPCLKGHRYEAEVYNLRDILMSSASYEETTAKRSLREAETHLRNWG